MLSATPSEVTATIFALGIVAACCAGAVVGTIAVTMSVHRRLSRRVPDIVETTLLLVVGSVMFAGGWLVWLIFGNLKSIWLDVHPSSVLK